MLQPWGFDWSGMVCGILCNRSEITEINISASYLEAVECPLFWGETTLQKKAFFHSNQNRGHQRVPGTHMSNCSSSLLFLTFKFFCFQNMFFFRFLKSTHFEATAAWTAGFSQHQRLERLEPRSRKERKTQRATVDGVSIVQDLSWLF